MILPVIASVLILLGAVQQQGRRSPLSPLLDEERSEQERTPPLLPAEAICRRADLLLDDGRRDAVVEARDLLAAAVEDHPGEVCVRAGLSRAIATLYLRGIEENDDLIGRSFEEAQRAIEADPEHPSAWAARALALLLDLKPHEAGRAAETALEKGPDSLRALQTAALIRMATGRLDPAREAIERAIELHPGLPANHLSLGNIHFLAGREREAILEYRRALELSPDFVPARLQAAAAMERIGRYGVAANIFRKLLADHPDESARANLLMGLSLMKRELWLEAWTVLGRAEFKTRRGLSNGTILYLQGRCLERLGEIEKARAAYRELIEQYPDATLGYGSIERLIFASYEALGRIHMKDGEDHAAAAVMEEGIRRTGASLDLHLRLAKLYDDYNLPEKAAELLETAVEREFEPRSAEEHLAAYILWARIIARREDPGARERLAASLARHSGEIDHLGDYRLDLRAMRALAIAGRGAEALDWLRRAVSRGYDHLAWIETDPELASLRRTPGFDSMLTASEGGSEPTD